MDLTNKWMADIMQADMDRTTSRSLKVAPPHSGNRPRRPVNERYPRLVHIGRCCSATGHLPAELLPLSRLVKQKFGHRLLKLCQKKSLRDMAAYSLGKE